MFSLNRQCSFWRYPTSEVQNESGPNCHINKVEIDIDNFLNEQKSTTKIIDMSEQHSVDSSAAASYFNSSRYFVQVMI